MAEVDYHRLISRLQPSPDGETPMRHRTAHVDAVNTDGTVDLDFDGTIISDAPVLATAGIEVGVTVQVAVWRGDLLVLGRVRDSAFQGDGHVLAHESIELTDLSSGTLGTWFDWSASTITIPNPGRKVRVSAWLSSGVLAVGGIDTASRHRVSIDIGAGATTGKALWLLTNDGGDAAIRRTSVTPTHSVEGTPSGTITVKGQRNHVSGGSAGDVTHNDATLTVIVVFVT